MAEKVEIVDCCKLRRSRRLSWRRLLIKKRAFSHIHYLLFIDVTTSLEIKMCWEKDLRRGTPGRTNGWTNRYGREEINLLKAASSSRWVQRPEWMAPLTDESVISPNWIDSVIHSRSRGDFETDKKNVSKSWKNTIQN